MKKTTIVIWAVVILIGSIMTGIGWGMAYNYGYKQATNEAEAWVKNEYQEWENDKQAETEELLRNVEIYVNTKTELGEEIFDLDNDGSSWSTVEIEGRNFYEWTPDMN